MPRNKAKFGNNDVEKKKNGRSKSPSRKNKGEKKFVKLNGKKKSDEVQKKKKQIGEKAHGEILTESMSKKESLEILEFKLQRRKSKDDIKSAGILKSPGKKDEKEKKICAIEKKIETRPNQTEVSDQILNPTGANRRLSGNLAQTARALERNITADKIDRHLVNRPDVEDLPVVDNTISAVIQGVQRQLQRQMNSDTVSQMLEKRPDVEDLKNTGVLQERKIAPGLQATQHKLERQMNADQVHQLLVTRPTQQEMIEHGIIEHGKVAPSLVSAARALERNLVHDQVQHLLETRPEAEELAKQNIFGENDVAPALQATKMELQKQLKADTISKHLRRRPSKEELVKEGVLQDVSKEEESFLTEKHSVTLSKRSRYAIGLKSASRLTRDGLIDLNERGRLKDLILSDDGRITAAIDCFELDNDAGEMLDTLYRVAKLA